MKKLWSETIQVLNITMYCTGIARKSKNKSTHKCNKNEGQGGEHPQVLT